MSNSTPSSIRNISIETNKSNVNVVFKAANNSLPNIHSDIEDYEISHPASDNDHLLGFNDNNDLNQIENSLSLLVPSISTLKEPHTINHVKYAKDSLVSPDFEYINQQTFSPVPPMSSDSFIDIVKSVKSAISMHIYPERIVQGKLLMN